MATSLLTLVEAHDYQRLFLENLRWSRPDMTALKVDLDEERTFTATNVSSYKGLRVWVCPGLPSSSDQASIDRAIAKQSTDRIVIFHDADKQVWRWPSRTAKEGTVTTRLTSHIHVRGMNNPKLLERLELITLGATERLGATDVIERVKQAFDVETERETKRASKLMAAMYDALGMGGVPEHDISVTLARILFLMFGDDTDMWDADLFQNFIINHTRTDGSDLAERINELFAHLNTKPDSAQDTPLHLKGFKYVNGGIFSEPIKLDAVGPEMRTTILDACSTNWAGISPAIFGSMFQSVRDDDTRREFGEHYTSEKDILKTLNPLFLDDLRSEFERAVGHREEFSRLLKLRERLSRIRFMDPACGCGNFIIIAYREMRLLEISILERLRIKESEQFVSLAPDQLEFGLEGELDAEGRSRTTLLDPLVRLDNFYGIEIDEWPAKIAETAMFLVDRQCDIQMRERLGYAPERLPISRAAKILTYDAHHPDGGNALILDWKQVFPAGPENIIAGNPPFVGISLRSDEQTEQLKNVWGGGYHGSLDFVTGWYKKAADYAGTTDTRVAFVSTSSICQGEQVAPLWGPLLGTGFQIDFAHQTFAWTSEATGAASVHVVIVGFSKKSKRDRELYSYSDIKGTPEREFVSNISPYLVEGPSIVVSPRTRPLSPSITEVRYGNKPTDNGCLIIESEELPRFMADPHAAKYVRPYVGARELLHDVPRWCLWLASMDQTDYQASALLQERVEGVRQFRLESKAASTRAAAATPHLFRQIAQSEREYLCIPRHVSEARHFFLSKRMSPEVVASDANFIADDPDGLLFAVISSSAFITWQRAVGGKLESRLRFNKLGVWNTFPMPRVKADSRAALIRAAQAVLDARSAYPNRTLASLYEPDGMPTDLVVAHEKLDQVMDEVLAGKSFKDDNNARLSELFRRYKSMV